MMGTRGKSHALQGFGHTRMALSTAHALNEQRILDILCGGEDRNQVKSLEDEPDLFATQRSQAGRAEGGRIDPADQDSASGGLVNATDQVEQGGLSATARTGDRQKLPGFCPQIDMVECADQVSAPVMVQGIFAAYIFDSDNLFHRYPLGKSPLSIGKITAHPQGPPGFSDEGSANWMKG
jgi:hypothetical protein